MPTWDSETNRLTNPYFSLTFEPRHGGRIVSLATLGGELTIGAAPDDLDRSRVPYHFGLFSLQLWQDSYWHNDLCHREWTMNVDITDHITVTLSGESALWPGVNVTRIVEVTDSPWIDISHELDPGSTTDFYLPPAFWFSNVMRGRGRTFVPGPAGVLEYPRWPQDQSWCHEPTDGWIAWTDSAGGLAFAMDAAQLRHVRVCHHPTDRVEWIRRRVAGVETTSVRVVPFSGLTRVDGVGPAGIVAVEPTRSGLAVDVYALLSGDATLTVELAAPDGTTTAFATSEKQVVAGAVTRFVLSGPTPPFGATWWRGTLDIADSQTTFTVPVEGRSRYLRGAVPATSPVTELPRDTGRRRPPRSFTFDAAPVPLPEPWLRRQGSRPRVLAIVEPQNTATLLALAHEFDFDLTLPFLPRTASGPIATNQPYNYELGDRFDTLYGQDLITAWEAALDSSRTYDVILLGSYTPNTGWDLLPESLQTEILDRVDAGTGLVVIRRADPYGSSAGTAVLNGFLPLTEVNESDYRGPWQPTDDRTVSGLPWAIMPSSGWIFNYTTRNNTSAEVLVTIDYAGQSLPVLARSTLAGRRVLDLVWAWGIHLVPPDSFRERPAGTEGMDTSRYDLALLARILCDAAGREPSIAVRNVSLSDNTASVQLERVDTTVSAFDLSWVARDRFGLILGGEQSSTGFPVDGIYEFSIPPGTWTVDVVVQPDDEEPGWGAGSRTLDFAVSTDPEVVVLGHEDAIQISPSEDESEVATEYVVDLLGGRGRIIERVSFPAGEGATLSVNRIETPRVDVRVHALDAERKLIGQALLRLRVPGRTGEGSWPIHFWNTPVLLPHPLLVRHLDTQASLGISGYFLLPASPLSAQDDIVSAADRLGIPYVVQSSGWLYTSGGQAPSGFGNPLSLTDGEDIATGMAGDTTLAASFADANVLYYRLADDEPDPPATDVSFDTRSLTRFRAWLSETYGHADSALQHEWGATATLAAATPLSYADAVSAFNSTTPRTYAQWVDHRRFIMDLFSRAPATAREALQHGDPQALAGTSGESRMGVARGRDWWVRGRALDVVWRYAVSTAIELKALGARSIYSTAYDDPDPLIRHRVWTALGLGEDGLLLFNETSLMNPDFSLPEVGRDLAAALLPVRRGVGGLFATSRPADDGIFVLTSPDSSAVLAIHGYENLGDWISAGASPPLNPPSRVDLGGDAREGVHDLLTAMGVGWSALSPADVETGALERSRARVLILPMCAGLSDAACISIRRWVAAGGRLIADLLPGTFTAHGRLRGTSISTTGSTTGALQGSTNPLDQVFGVVPGARPPINNATVSVDGGHHQFTVRCLDTAVPMPALATAGGISTGVKPLWFQYAYGQGRAAYLACSVFADYGAASSVDRSRIEKAFSALLQGFGVAPRAQVVDADGERVELCQFHVRSVGSTELVVLLRYYLGIDDPVAPEVDGELRFSTEAHTYDLDNGVYLGYGDRLQLRVSAYTFRAFARLPYRVRDIDVQVASAPGGLDRRHGRVEGGRRRAAARSSLPARRARRRPAPEIPGA